MAQREYTISLAGKDGWERATIFNEDGVWYYSLRTADPHGEEYVGDVVGPFPTAAEAEKQARASFIPPETEV